MYQPRRLFLAQQVKQGEVAAANSAGVSMYQLMLAAGESVFELLLTQYSQKAKVLVLCGGGNNGGDGYVVAKLALQQEMTVDVFALKSPKLLTGDAQKAYQDFISAGGRLLANEPELGSYDVAVDAVLGTGLQGQVRDAIAGVILKVNQARLPVIAVDVPSGLCSDTGMPLGVSIQAAHTVTFIGIKQGLVTGQARRYVGSLSCAGLGIERYFNQQNSAVGYWDLPQLLSLLKPRDLCAHKGTLGKALLIGGDFGMGGAILIASKACLKTGAGLTACLTDERNVMAGLVASPEVMFAPWESIHIGERLDWCDAIALGPGLGHSERAKQLFLKVRQSSTSKVLDADALRFLSQHPSRDSKRIITPHPGEAALLLGCTVNDVESNRYQAAQKLQVRYGGVVVLKGAGTIIHDGSHSYVCGAGNPGMATGGMGDALTGILVSLLAQGFGVSLAARIGVMIHSYAADLNAKQNGIVGLSASDVIGALRVVVNHLQSE
ncbi:NAD(P)H-hydrate dehydratase [Vibrio fluminensis]|uniref:NAD(P)H-hydrate dehydratase n=1 Tax=Vibrio fluminensis TaxID=2783614 RepID=UPI0018872303|nr:NAD(P)H-hydrate dehydratase [Vibrio fluminensis]